MTSRFEPVSDALLRRIAGPAVYARGADYHAKRRVTLLGIDGQRALARVRGTEVYQVELRSDRGRPRGACDCPAFDDAGFCKHLVAVALTVNEAVSEGRTPPDRLAAARQYLRGQGVDALVERLLRHAIRDAALLDEIELEAAESGGDDETLMVRYRAAIDEACDTSGGFDWQGPGLIAEAIDDVLARLKGLIAAGRSSIVLSLLDHLFDEMDQAFEEVDDSDGEIGDVLARAGALHLQACRQARPDPVALAGSLFERQVNSDWNTFEDAAPTYAEVLGDTGLAEYRRLATRAWEAPGAEQSWTLKSILDGFAEREGDLEARIALRKRDLKTPSGYIEIARLLDEAGRRAEAIKWLEEALWCFEDRPEERLHVFTADLLIDAGRLAEAETLLWAAFARWPSLSLYRKLQKAAVDAKPRIERALSILRQRLEAPADPWRKPAAVVLEIQMAEGLMDDAWATAEAHDVGDAWLEALANASAASHPGHAAGVYEKLIEARVKAGGAFNYDAAMALIERLATTHQDEKVLAAYLADLAVRHKAKRTFIARLQSRR